MWTYGPFGNLAHDLFFVLGDSKPNPLVFAASLPFLLMLSFLENHTPTRHGSGLLAIVRKPAEAMKASIFVLMDALGWEWIKEHPFLKEVAPYRRPLDSVLGFSTAAIPSILTGRFPARAWAAVAVPSRERALAVREAEASSARCRRGWSRTVTCATESRRWRAG